MGEKQTKALVLEIEVPGWYADDLEERVALIREDCEMTDAEAALYLVTEEMLDSGVELTALTLGTERDTRPELAHSHGRIVGARIGDRA